MKAHLKEFFDTDNLEVLVAVIWVQISSLEPPHLAEATARLSTFISKYVSNRPYSVYVHSEKDSVSATVLFDINKYPSKFIEI